jgi:hypothetical protein
MILRYNYLEASQEVSWCHFSGQNQNWSVLPKHGIYYQNWSVLELNQSGGLKEFV